MRLIVAILFAVISFSSFGETLVVRTPHAIVKPVIRKVKLLRSNPHRYTAIHVAGEDPTTEIDDEDIIPERRHRSRLEQEIDTDVSDYVKARLLIARAKALKKFAETHDTLV